MSAKLMPETLKWCKSDAAVGDYDTGFEYEFVASTPFGVSYVVYLDDPAYEEMAGAADEDHSVSPADWERIRKKHGEPSEASPMWRVSLRADGVDEFEDVVSGYSLFNAQVAAYLDYTHRINQAMGIDYKYPDFEAALNPASLPRDAKSA